MGKIQPCAYLRAALRGTRAAVDSGSQCLGSVSTPLGAHGRAHTNNGEANDTAH